LSAPADAIQIADAETGAVDIVFHEHLVPPRSRGGAFFASAAGHCAFFFLLPHLASINFFTEEPPLKVFVARMQTLNVRVNQPLYAPAPPPRPRQSPETAGTKTDSRPGTKVLIEPAPAPEGASAPPAPPAPAKPAVVAKKFEMPAPTPRASATQAVILQPPSPTVGMPVQQLPHVVAWNDPVLPRPKPKAFVTPGTRQAAPQKPPELTAPPTLQVSSRNGAPSPLNFGPAPAPPARPKLVLPQSKSVPVRLPDALPEMNDGEIGTSRGDPTNLIIMSGVVGKPNELVAVPPGSNVPNTVTEGTGSGRSGSVSTHVAGTGLGSGSGAAVGAGNGTGPGSGKGGTGTGASGKNGAGNGAGSGPPGGAGGTGAGSANFPGGIGVSGAGSLGSSGKMAAVINLSPAPPPAASPMPAPAARRGTVKPGVFDVIVVQSAAAETQFRSFGILKGKPIYTVYLQLNTPKAWILQYCLPPAAASSAVSGVVRLDDPQPVTPPYPVTTVMSEVDLQPKTSYTLIHGFLTVEGKFRNMILMGKVDPQLARLLQLLEKWEFRPAMKGDTPAEVEVLLAIPPV
jgi:hypothetical protein